MKRIGMVKVSGHSYFFGGMFNKSDLDELKNVDGTVARVLALDEEPSIPVADARVTRVWDADRQKAERFASICGVEAVAGDPAAMVGEVDAILLAETSEDGADHARLALPFLEAGIPILVDKPFSNNLPDAVKMVEAAKKTGTPLMSSSLLRYVLAVEELRAEAESIGEIRHVVASGPGGTLVYGIHACEFLLTVSAGTVESVWNLGHKGLDLVSLKYCDGRTAVMQIFRNSPVDFNITVYGQKGNRSRSVPILAYRHGAAVMMQQFAKMVDTGQPPIPYEETLQILKVLFAAMKSLAEDRGVRLSEL